MSQTSIHPTAPPFKLVRFILCKYYIYIGKRVVVIWFFQCCCYGEYRCSSNYYEEKFSILNGKSILTDCESPIYDSSKIYIDIFHIYIEYLTLSKNNLAICTYNQNTLILSYSGDMKLDGPRAYFPPHILPFEGEKKAATGMILWAAWVSFKIT